MKQTVNEDLQKELGKFKKLFEYQFYVNDNKSSIIDEDDDEEFKDEPTDLSGGDAEGDNQGGEGDASQEEPALGPDANSDSDPAMGGGDMGADAPIDQAPADDMGGGMPQQDMNADPAMGGGDMGATDEVVVDVTSIVKTAEDAKNSTDLINTRMTTLIQKFEELNSQLPKFDNINAKIEDLKKELEVRNPTEIEKLSMRSLDSFPYSVKLSDYWNDAPQGYSAGNDQEVARPEEYVLTDKDVVDDYNPGQVKNSLNM